jgi:ribonuclease Z
MQVIFLGSGSALPTKERMLSAMVINRDGEKFLFDCGESTQFQMTSASVKPFKIKNIFITHLHGDHIFGLPGLLSTMSLLKRSDPITIYGPSGIKLFLETSFTVSGLIPRYEIKIEELPDDIDSRVLIENDEYIISAKKIEHSVISFGYRFEEKDKAGHLDINKATELGLTIGPLIGELKKGNSIQIDGKTINPEDVLGEKIKGKTICYATDTKYSLNTIELARNADVLIHEATFDASLSNKAIEMLHSTTYDAANVAKEANVKLLIITHISSRNEDIEKLIEECKSIFPNTIAAYDFLRLSI